MTQAKDNKWLIFVAFTLLLFAKCLLFHWSVFHSILISSLWREPLEFFKFYVAKLLMPLCIASFTFISKRQWWTIIVAFLVDFWCIANSIYYKTYDCFLTIDDIQMADNMDGFWSSVLSYVDWTMAVSLLLTFLWFPIVYYCSRNVQYRYWAVPICIWGLVLPMACLNNYFIYHYRLDANVIDKHKDWQILTQQNGHLSEFISYLPFNRVSNYARYGFDVAYFSRYVHQQSILSYGVAALFRYCWGPKQREIISLTPKDESSIKPFLRNGSVSCSPCNSLVLILVESMESWPLESEELSKLVTPNLSKLIQNQHVLYASRIRSQAQKGGSGDGQMIINTGLLPIVDGAACMTYYENIYPNVAGLYSESYIVNPCSDAWNQLVMSQRYGYNKEDIPKGENWQDAQILSHTLDNIQALESPFCIQAITISMHCPFDNVKGDIHKKLTAPNVLNNYLQCYHYTDSCIGAFMDKLLADSELSQSTVVITGDHTIFKSAMLEQFRDYAVANNLSIASGESFCPLIIYSPKIEQNKHIDDLCYQMDIFPTILHLIGCENYYWHGFGVNLLDSVARHNRTISEEEAYRLSDLIIRSDYFRNYYQIEQN